MAKDEQIKDMITVTSLWGTLDAVNRKTMWIVICGRS